MAFKSAARGGDRVLDDTAQNLGIHRTVFLAKLLNILQSTEHGTV